jgi:peptide chain release factor 1
MPLLPDNLTERLDELAEQYDQCQADLLDPDIVQDHRRVRELSIRRAALGRVVEPYQAYRHATQEHNDTESMLSSETDNDLRSMIHDELESLKAQVATLAEEIQSRLVRADDDSIGSVILEIRAGVGGDEAALWAGDLLEMYQRYASSKGWKLEMIESAPGEMGGVRGAMVSIGGDGAWSCLGYEGGTHQVKRVPATEAQGRVHTSTATVAVLPEPEEVEVQLDESDVKEMITTATGPGGQNVNKVSTAVHLIHEPTGVEVRMQDTKSQAQNRQKAWQLLRARLYERQRAERDAQRAEKRAAMIGSGSRAEKIRTYRYKDSIAVDSRIKGNFPLQAIMQGELQPLIDGLIELDTAQRLAAL